MNAADLEFCRRLEAAARAAGAGRRAGVWPRLRRAIRSVGVTMMAALFVTAGVALGDVLSGGGKRFTLSLLALVLCFDVHQRLAKLLYQSPDLLAMSLLPVSREWAFRRHLRRGLLELLFLPPLGMALALVARLGVRPTEISPLGAAVAGVFMGVFFAGLGILALRWRHAATVRGSLWTGLVVVWLGNFVAPVGLKQALLEFLNKYGDAAAGLLPTGWVIGPLHRWLGGESHASDALWLLPAGAVLTLIPAVLRWARTHYRFRDAVLLEYAAEPPADCDAEDREAIAEQHTRPSHTGLTEVTERILSREFLLPASGPDRGWIERLVWRWWTPRERLLAEWDWAGSPPWTWSWRTGAMLLAGGLILTLVGRVLGWLWLEAALPAGGILGGLACLPVFTGFAGGRLAVPPAGSLEVAPLMPYPRTSGELLRLLLKASVVRALAALPLALIFGALAGHLREVTWLAGADLGLRACFASCVVAPLMFTARIATGSNDTQRFRLGTFLVVGGHLVGFLGAGGLLVAGFAAPGGWWFLLGAAAVSAFWSAAYRVAVSRFWFDLMKRN